MTIPEKLPLTDKATELFYQFARTEYALKAAGFYCPNQVVAKADWRRFAESSEIVVMFETPKTRLLADAIQYIKDNPPKKQTIVNELLAWSDAKPSTNLDSDLILIYVRRIRNNLFHGGKFNGHWFAPERSERLIDAALQILRSCRKASTEVGRAYRDGSG